MAAGATFHPNANHHTNRPWYGGRGAGVSINRKGTSRIRKHRSGDYLKYWGSRPEHKRREVRRAA